MVRAEARRAAQKKGPKRPSGQRARLRRRRAQLTELWIWI
jgi:hypothetical protein